VTDDSGAAALVVALVFLLRNYVGERIRQDVRATYEKQLAEHRAALSQELDGFRARLQQEAEKHRMELQTLVKQREASACLAELLEQRYFAYDAQHENEWRAHTAAAYWKLIPWLSADLVVALSDCLADNGQHKDDVRRLLEVMRQETQGESYEPLDPLRMINWPLIPANLDVSTTTPPTSGGGPSEAGHRQQSPEAE